MWYCFPGYGLYELDGVAATEINATGAHGYPTQAEANAHPNASPNGIQAALLDAFNTASLDPVGAGTPGILVTPHSTGGVSGLGSNIAGNIGSALTGGSPTSDLAHRLTEPAVWVRVAEFLAGGILIYIGLKAATASEGAKSPGLTATRKAGRTTKKIPKSTVGVAKQTRTAYRTARGK
jgi:hypothetical protein